MFSKVSCTMLRNGKNTARLACAALLAGLLAAFTAGAETKDLQVPSTPPPKDAPELAPLLASDSGAEIATREEWEKKRPSLLRKWQEILGAGFPEKRAELRKEILDTEELEGFTRQHIRYQTEEGVWNDAYLLVPSGPEKERPGMVVFHQTIASNAGQAAGVDRSVPELMQGEQLVKKGYIVLCPRNFIFAEGADWEGNVKIVQKRHPGWTGMAQMTWDAIRAADLIESVPGVDRSRIGAIGHSLGAKQALYAIAFDTRYRAAVFSEGGIGFGSSNWDAPWYLGEKVKACGKAADHHQLLALAAPRPFLLLAGGDADTDRSRSYLLAAMPVYRLYGAEKNLGWLNHGTGHRYPEAAQAAAEAFLDSHLKPN